MNNPKNEAFHRRLDRAKNRGRIMLQPLNHRNKLHEWMDKGFNNQEGTMDESKTLDTIKVKYDTTES